MKILAIHSDFVEFCAKKKAFKGAESINSKDPVRVEECLVVFTAVEKADEEYKLFILISTPVFNLPVLAILANALLTNNAAAFK